MFNESFESAFADWKSRAESINQQLQPVVKAKVDTSAPDWLQQLENSPHPADESGLRQEIQSLFNEIIAKFQACDVDQRQQIIDLMDQNDCLMYSAVIDGNIDTTEGFRRKMVLVVLEDQGKDPRDTVLTLAQLRKEAEKNSIDADAIFREMAAIASKRDKYGWGSTSDLLLKH